MSRLLIFVTASLIFFLALLSPISYAGSDPHFTTLVAQSLIYHKTPALDAYIAAVPGQFTMLDYQLFRNGGQTFYVYPPGASLFALPFVLVALLTGHDMITPAHNHAVQNVVSAVACGLLFVALYRLCRAWTGRRSAYAIALVSLLGSSMISTLATALWNQTGITLLSALTLDQLARKRTGRTAAVTLVLLLFGAYLSRPSAIVFIGVVLLYLAWTDRRLAAQVAPPLLLLLIVWMGVNFFYTGRLLSPYYRLPVHPLLVFGGLAIGGWWVGRLPDGWLGRQKQAVLLPDGILGLTFSASRGLFILSPFTLVVLAAVVRVKLWREKLVWLVSLWVGLIAGAAVVTDFWSGGSSFGTRILTEVWPGIVLVTAIGWHYLEKEAGSAERRIWAAAYLLLGAVGILINSGAGLFNTATAEWNAYPAHTESYLFDWRYPQYLASAEMLDARIRDYWQAAAPPQAHALPPLPACTTITPDDGITYWDVNEYRTEVYLRLGEKRAESIVLVLNAAEPQTLEVNNQYVVATEDNLFVVPTALLYDHTINRLEIRRKNQLNTNMAQSVDVTHGVCERSVK